MLKFWTIIMVLIKIGLSDGFVEYGVSLFAGTPKTTGSTGDGGPATSANFAVVRGLWISSVDEVYISDYGNSRIRKVTTTGIVISVAGTISNPTSSSGGDGDAATSSALMKPWGICGDSNGNIFMAESTGHLVRKISLAGAISLVAGMSGTQTDIALANNPGTVDLGDGGSAEYGSFRTPSAVFAVPNGDLLIADKNNCRVRIVIGITIYTFAGTGGRGAACSTTSGDGGQATSAMIKNPGSVWRDSLGNTYLSEDLGYRVRRVDGVTGLISTAVGTGTQATGSAIVDGVPATSSRILGNPMNIWGDSSGILYVGAQHQVREVDTRNGLIATLAGFGNTQSYAGDGGPAYSAQFNTIYQVGGYTNGKLVLADGANFILRVMEVLSMAPTAYPSTIGPTLTPTTYVPTLMPVTVEPTTTEPTQPTAAPYFPPTQLPTSAPSDPTFSPTNTPVPTMTPQPSLSPTDAPSTSPTLEPTAPTYNPSKRPSLLPTEKPTWSQKPTIKPTRMPTARPSEEPTTEPSEIPTEEPTLRPTARPSNPSYRPSGQPNPVPSRRPTFVPTLYPTQPTVVPTLKPSVSPTTTGPTVSPTTTQPSMPTQLPTTIAPTNTRLPTTIKPSMRPTRYMPTFRPTWKPSVTGKPSFSPTRPWEEIVFSSTLCLAHLSPTVLALTKIDKKVVCQVAAHVMSVPLNNVTVVGEELTTTETSNTICAEVSTYAQTRLFPWVVDSNATRMYEVLAHRMNQAVLDRNFTSIMQNVSASMGSTNLLTADAASVTVQAYSYYVFVVMTDDDYLSDEAVAGVSLFGVLGAFCVVALTLAVCSVMEEKGF